MVEFIAPSGAKIVINSAPWKDAKALKMAIEQEATKENVAAALSDPDKLAHIIVKLDGSTLVDAALWPCLIRCTRNNQKITENIFDEAEARKDYYDIIIACAKENLGPLVESLFSKFLMLGLTVKQAKSGDTPKSE